MRKIFYLFTLILLSNALYSAEKINYDIKDLKYDILIDEDAEIEVNCERYSKSGELLDKICSNSKSDDPRFTIITYSKLQEYMRGTDSKIESINGSRLLVENKFNYLGTTKYSKIKFLEELSRSNPGSMQST